MFVSICFVSLRLPKRKSESDGALERTLCGAMLGTMVWRHWNPFFAGPPFQGVPKGFLGFLEAFKYLTKQHPTLSPCFLFFLGLSSGLHCCKWTTAAINHCGKELARASTSEHLAFEKWLIRTSQAFKRGDASLLVGSFVRWSGSLTSV